MSSGDESDFETLDGIGRSGNGKRNFKETREAKFEDHRKVKKNNSVIETDGIVDKYPKDTFPGLSKDVRNGTLQKSMFVSAFDTNELGNFFASTNNNFFFQLCAYMGREKHEGKYKFAGATNIRSQDIPFKYVALYTCEQDPSDPTGRKLREEYSKVYVIFENYEAWK